MKFGINGHPLVSSVLTYTLQRQNTPAHSLQQTDVSDLENDHRRSAHPNNGYNRSPLGVSDLVGNIVPAIRYNLRIGVDYRTARFGRFSGLALDILHIVDTRRVQNYHWNISVRTDEETLAWKASYLAWCNGIAVAGAIFAQVGLSALTLPAMGEVHWSARACCVASMLLGVLSVMAATQQHLDVGMLNSPIEVRLWLSRGKPKAKGRRSGGQGATARYESTKPFAELPLESSIGALKAVSLPQLLLRLAAFVFTIGLGLWILFQWVFHGEGELGIPWRNVFVAYVCTYGANVLYASLIRISRLADGEKRELEFALGYTGNWDVALQHQQLEQLQVELDAARRSLRRERPRSGYKSEDGSMRHRSSSVHLRPPSPV